MDTYFGSKIFSFIVDPFSDRGWNSFDSYLSERISFSSDFSVNIFTMYIREVKQVK